MKKVIIKKPLLNIHVQTEVIARKDSKMIAIRELLTFKTFLFFRTNLIR